MGWVILLPITFFWIVSYCARSPPVPNLFVSSPRCVVLQNNWHQLSNLGKRVSTFQFETAESNRSQPGGSTNEMLPFAVFVRWCVFVAALCCVLPGLAAGVGDLSFHCNAGLRHVARLCSVGRAGVSRSIAAGAHAWVIITSLYANTGNCCTLMSSVITSFWQPWFVFGFQIMKITDRLPVILYALLPALFFSKFICKHEVCASSWLNSRWLMRRI